MNAVQFDRVCRHYGEVKAVDDISFQIPSGEFFTLLGPSGSGKTTCLRMIAGFEYPSNGEIRLFGEPCSTVPPYDRNLNTVFQDYALFPNMDVRDNIGYGLMLKGVAKAERYRKVDEMLELVRLSGYAKLDAMYDDGDAGDSDMFITSEIPVDGGHDKARFNMHARQTRFTIEARRDTGAGPLRFVLQNDFFGSGGSYGYRLRHAYGQLGNTYAGFGWSAFMDLDSGPDTLDFAGPGASPSARLASIRQYIPLRGGNQLIIAAEHRPPELQLAGATQQSRTAAPNLVLAARHEADPRRPARGPGLRQQGRGHAR